jgi:hypothetical protein
MYFNPAGLVNFDGLENTMVTFEAGTGVKYDEESDIHEDKQTSFFGISSIGKDSGFGFAIYSLYDLNLKDSNNNYFKEEVKVMSMSLSSSLINQLYPYGGKLAIGVTGAYASSISSDNDTLDVGGYFYAVGLKYRALNHHAWKIDIGANYRSSATLESNPKSYSSTFSAIGVPQETAYGVAISYGTEIGLFTLAGDYKDTAYDDATKESDFNLKIPNVTTTNLGFEFATSLYQQRVGTYKSSYTNGSGDAEITGITAGLGIIVDGSLSLEGASDLRISTYNTSAGTRDTPDLYYTVSANMAF